LEEVYSTRVDKRVLGAIQVIYSKYSSGAVFLLASLPLVLTAQTAQQTVVPLNNWPTPLYWQPDQAEIKAHGLSPHSDDAQPPAPEEPFLTFVAMTPCRLVDTRGEAALFYGNVPFSGAPGPILRAGTATFPVQSSTQVSTGPAPCPAIPSIAAAYSVNLVVIPQAGAQVGYVTLWPAGPPPPYVATLNDLQGLVVGNAAIVAAGTPYGGISVYNSGPATIDVVIDMNGYFASPTDGNGNTAIGAGTLAGNTSGTSNTASGADALEANTTGSNNTANGFNVLEANTIGSNNTASGYNALVLNTTGSDNTAIGASALLLNTSGSFNTASGIQALQNNTTGSFGTATGAGALTSNTTGGSNTASGFNALTANTTGGNNTASGATALGANTTGAGNTASGYDALGANTTGYDNVASGSLALLSNTIGGFNVASGAFALEANSSGNSNTADGEAALQANSTGNYNTASGAGALSGNAAGGNNTAFGYQALLANSVSNNTAVGYQALSANTIGANNIAIGSSAAVNAPPAISDSIYIGSAGTGSDAAGSIVIGTAATEAGGTISIGSAQTGGTSIAGISGGTPNATNLPVCVDANGVLGTNGCNIVVAPPSSLRFKDQIADMGDRSDKLLQLRPVTFLYKPQYDDGSHALQYGLIAEEVAKLYPEMVGYDKAGQPASIKYQLLAPMLLNELQKQAQQIRKQADQNRELEDRLAALEAALP
jgi:hypothetical protein